MLDFYFFKKNSVEKQISIGIPQVEFPQGVGAADAENPEMFLREEKCHQPCQEAALASEMWLKMALLWLDLALNTSGSLREVTCLVREFF